MPGSFPLPDDLLIQLEMFQNVFDRCVAIFFSIAAFLSPII